MTDHKIYLEDIPWEEAIARWQAALQAVGAWDPLPAESVPLAEALGRVTAAPVWARLSSPHYHAAAMDGYAVRADETRGASEATPLKLEIGRQAFPVDTGDPLPPATDAVIMIEHVQPVDDGRAIEIMAAVPPWQHVRALGEDIVASELVLPTSHRLRPQDLGAIAGCGHTSVLVHRRPRVAILPTGSELVAPGAPLQPGNIIEFNSLMLAAQATEAGCLVDRLPIQADDYAAIRDAAEAALADHDLVIINAGSSAGSEDYTAAVIADLGQVVVHGVAIRPGHPVVLGVAQGKAVVGLPGYPVSTALTFDLLVRPLLYRWQGMAPPPRPRVAATLARKVVSPAGLDEFLRVTVGQVGDRLIAAPLASGAGALMSLVKADGIVTIPRLCEGYHAGETVEVELLRPLEAIRQTIVAVGSHDLTLDLLADHLQQRHTDRRLTSAHVGSLGGLLALQRGEAHLAGAHLFDPETGEYNVSYIERLLAAHREHVVVVGFVNRRQGLIVAPGNPKQIVGLEDLRRPDVSFVNRQRGAGTRVRLDYELARLQIDPARIRGYERQEFTHLAVAAAVQSGVADCGLGILAAARALGLDFVPLFDERYDLVIAAQFYESELLEPLLALIRKPESAFRQAVAALGGYDLTPMGTVLAVI